VDIVRQALAYLAAIFAAMAANAAVFAIAAPETGAAFSLAAFPVFAALLAPFAAAALVWEVMGRRPSLVLYTLAGLLSAFAFVALRDVYLGVFDLTAVTAALGKLLKTALRDPLFDGSIVPVAGLGGFVFALLRKTVLASPRAA